MRKHTDAPAETGMPMIVHHAVDMAEILRPLDLNLGIFETALDRAESEYPAEVVRLRTLLEQLRDADRRFELLRGDAESRFRELQHAHEEEQTALEAQIADVVREMAPIRRQIAEKEAAFRQEAAKYGITCDADADSYREALRKQAGTITPVKPVPPADRKENKAAKVAMLIYAGLVGILVMTSVLLATGMITYAQYRDNRIPALAFVLMPLGIAFVIFIGETVSTAVKAVLNLETEVNSSKPQRTFAWTLLGFAIFLWAVEIGAEAFGISRLMADWALVEGLLDSSKKIDQAPFWLIFALCFIFTTPYFVVKAAAAYAEAMDKIRFWRAERQYEADVRESEAALKKLLYEDRPKLRDLFGTLAELEGLRLQLAPLQAREEELRQQLAELGDEATLPETTIHTLVRERDEVRTLHKRMCQRVDEL